MGKKGAWTRIGSWQRTAAAIPAAMAVCALLLFAFACIPRSLLKDQAGQSADYFCGHDAFPVLLGDRVNSMQDNYADTYTLAVAYGVDEGHPFTSAMKAMYTQGKYETIADGFQAQVYEERTLDREYGRYWHGMMPYVRFLMLFTDIRYMRLIAGTATVLIFLFDLVLLYRRGKKAVAICMGMAFVGIQPWMLFFCLEYVPAFFVAAVAVLFVLLKKSVVDSSDMTVFFSVVGVVTCFTDFLSTETITFTLPMLVIIVLREEGEFPLSLKDRGGMLLAGGASWAAGYVGMQAGKFALLYVICGRKVFGEAVKEAVYRMGGDVYLGDSNLFPVATTWQKYRGAIWHNLAALFPTRTDAMTEYRAVFPALLLLVVCFSMIYLFHAKMYTERIVPMVILALIPYARYLALSNHSYMHFFFTYRAQMITLLVLLLITWENALLPLLSRLKEVRRGK